MCSLYESYDVQLKYGRTEHLVQSGANTQHNEGKHEYCLRFMINSGVFSQLVYQTTRNAATPTDSKNSQAGKHKMCYCYKLQHFEEIKQQS